MLILELPAELAEEAVGPWHRSGLTRPWNDPHADLHARHEALPPRCSPRAMTGPGGPTLAVNRAVTRLVATLVATGGTGRPFVEERHGNLRE